MSRSEKQEIGQSSDGIDCNDPILGTKEYECWKKRMEVALKSDLESLRVAAGFSHEQVQRRIEIILSGWEQADRMVDT
ncbi:MAG: hypothetical protein AAB407_03555 [Patescibacteria group bacterium]